MSQACAGGPDRETTGRHAGAPWVTEALALAAAPTFAIMALISAMMGKAPAETLCSATAMSPLSGMTTMYLLMSTFHAAPWLKLIRASTSSSSRGGRVDHH